MELNLIWNAIKYLVMIIGTIFDNKENQSLKVLTWRNDECTYSTHVDFSTLSKLFDVKTSNL